MILPYNIHTRSSWLTKDLTYIIDLKEDKDIRTLVQVYEHILNFHNGTILLVLF